jgi:hypothetical protein
MAATQHLSPEIRFQPFLVAENNTALQGAVVERLSGGGMYRVHIEFRDAVKEQHGIEDLLLGDASGAPAP